jgi:hypothetical protein
MERELGKFIYLYSLGHAHQLYNALGYLILSDVGSSLFYFLLRARWLYTRRRYCRDKNTSTAAATSIFLPPARPPYDVTRPTTCADAYRYDNSASREITGSCVCVCVCACDEMFKSATRQLYSKTSATFVCLSVCLCHNIRWIIYREKEKSRRERWRDGRSKSVAAASAVLYIITAA